MKLESQELKDALLAQLKRCHDFCQQGADIGVMLKRAVEIEAAYRAAESEANQAYLRNRLGAA